MDEGGADPAQLRKSLAFIQRVNRYFGYARATIHHLDRLTRTWPGGRPIEILDLATGSADIPRAILKWADAKRFDVRVVAVDRQRPTIQTARDWNSEPRLHLVQADVFDLPFEPASFDYVTANMFFHHLSEDQVVTLMQSMSRLARHGVIIADLLRHYRAYAWAWFFTLASNPMVRHDARASIRQAFRKDEILRLRDRAGLDFVQYYRHFGHRFVLAGAKPDR
jgi:ubiquinone/menaquinone biosynthesis C-methylase UbiE